MSLRDLKGHDALGPAVDTGYRCERRCRTVRNGQIREWREYDCGGGLMAYANTSPPRAIYCSKCGHESFEIPLGAEKGVA